MKSGRRGWKPRRSGGTPRPPRAAKFQQLKRGAISDISNIVIGVASTAPGYSLAATIGFIAVRADSSIPFQQIHVSAMMKTTPRIVTSVVLLAMPSRPNS